MKALQDESFAWFPLQHCLQFTQPKILAIKMGINDLLGSKCDNMEWLMTAASVFRSYVIIDANGF